MKRAFITGVTGQSGSYLAELLLSKGYEVYGLVRPGATPRTANISHIIDSPAEPDAMPIDGPKLQLVYGDLTDSACLERLLSDLRPDEVYNLGAQAHVKVSFDLPEYTADVTGLGVLRLLEAVRRACPKARVYQAGSSEMFGASPPKQSETTPFLPRSPYACAKVFAFNIACNYREAYGLRISCGILHNHESPRRGQHYVTRKTTLSVARIVAGLQHELRLGNLEARRDWGYAGEYVEGMWRMLQSDPADFVLATGESHTVRELVEVAFSHAGLDWRKYVVLDERFLRPTEVNHLCGDASKAERVLGWTPTWTFRRLVEHMVDIDVERVRRSTGR